MKNNIEVQFVTETQVEVTIGRRVAVVDAPDPTSARLLAALAEAGLLEVNGDRLEVRRAEAPINNEDRLESYERHGHMLVIAHRKGQRKRELVFAVDLVGAVLN